MYEREAKSQHFSSCVCHVLLLFYKGMKQFNSQIIVYEISNNFATLNIPFIYSEMKTER